MKPSDSARRLHPLTIVQRLIVSTPALIFILLPIIRNPDSAALFNLLFGAAYVMVVLPWIILYYVRFRYWVTPTELIIHSGVVTRRRRNIPVERIQNIEIEQAPLQRILGTAKVAVYTAGSASAEGVLEYVSLKEAREIREVVREMQQELKSGTVKDETNSLSEQEVLLDPEVKAHAGVELLRLSTKRVLLAGAFKFSLLYIAAFFSLLQYIEPDPTVFFAWLLRGPLQPWRTTIEASPWLAGFLGVFLAAFLGWLSGILISLNRYHRFRIELIGDKLHRAHGLMTLSEGTIPLRRIQSFIIRSNPLMQYFGWYRLELQTMGINLKESGFQVAIPFGRMTEIQHVLSVLGSGDMPPVWNPVSVLTIRRFTVRLSVVLILFLSILRIWIPPAYWGLLLIPIIFLFALARYRNMGYAHDSSTFSVRTGVFRKYVWLIPVEKMQTFSRRASLFQRRLGLSTLYLDTAGASPVSLAEVVDIPSSEAQELLASSYERFVSS